MVHWPQWVPVANNPIRQHAMVTANYGTDRSNRQLTAIPNLNLRDGAREGMVLEMITRETAHDQ